MKDRQLTPVHLNGNLLCSIDVRTTGPDVLKHEIYEIGILPVDSFLVRRRDKLPLDILLKPNREDLIDWKFVQKGWTSAEILKRALKQGHPQHVGFSLFERWKDDLDLPYNKRIAPIGYNYAFESRFLRQWRGPLFYETVFDDSNVRDIRVIARFLNDLADVRDVDYPFPKVILSYLAKILHVNTDYGQERGCLHVASIQTDIYRELIRHIQKEVTI
jgi:hypothetical protein